MIVWWVLGWVACGGPVDTPQFEPLSQTEQASLMDALTWDIGEGPLNLHKLEAVVVPDEQTGSPSELKAFHGAGLHSYRVSPVTFSLRPGFAVAGALFAPVAEQDKNERVGVVVTQGHFGQGKSAPETQEIAHELAARGVWVLAVDTPGMEEWDSPGRHIHFDKGAHNRAFLNSIGQSAIALQLANLRRGVDLLEELGVQRIGATGASGGAVQALYLSLVDDRVEAAVLAAPPPMPREARAGGCACDQIPGWPGPDARVIALADESTLWLADGLHPRPDGLADNVPFRSYDAPHTYTEQMQRQAVEFLADKLGFDGGRDVGSVTVAGEPWRPPLLALTTNGPSESEVGIFELPLPDATGTVVETEPDTPKAKRSWDGLRRLPYQVACEGSGIPVVMLAAPDADLSADISGLVSHGLQPCRVSVTGDDVGFAEGVATGRAQVDQFSYAVFRAARQVNAKGVWAVGAWGVAVVDLGLPFVVRDPPLSPADLNLTADPVWVHMPNAWNGELARRWGLAVAVGADVEDLAQNLGAVLVE